MACEPLSKQIFYLTYPIFKEMTLLLLLKVFYASSLYFSLSFLQVNWGKICDSLLKVLDDNFKFGLLRGFKGDTFYHSDEFKTCMSLIQHQTYSFQVSSLSFTLHWKSFLRLQHLILQSLDAFVLNKLGNLKWLLLNSHAKSLFQASQYVGNWVFRHS